MYQDLMLANEELATEVDKLYKAEDQQLGEREKLMKDLKETWDQTEFEKKLRDEKSKLEIQIHQLNKSLEITKLENERLYDNRKTVEHPLPHFQKVKSLILFFLN